MPEIASPNSNTTRDGTPRPGVLYVEKRTGWGRPGCESLRAIAAALEERGIPTARGGKWSAVQVARLLEAASIPFAAASAAA